MSADHTPIGTVAFRCEPRDLHASAQDLYIQALGADPEICRRLTFTGGWYDALARDMATIRGLPEVYPPRTTDSQVEF